MLWNILYYIMSLYWKRYLFLPKVSLSCRTGRNSFAISLLGSNSTTELKCVKLQERWRKDVHSRWNHPSMMMEQLMWNKHAHLYYTVFVLQHIPLTRHSAKTTWARVTDCSTAVHTLQQSQWGYRDSKLKLHVYCLVRQDYMLYRN